jgi:hypothetical protein
MRESDVMVSKKPLFKVVDSVDSSVRLEDLPHLEILPEKVPDSKELGATQRVQVKPEETPGFAAPVRTVAQGKIKEPVLKGLSLMISQEGSGFRGYPPLPVLSVGLFLLVVMFLGD